MWSSRLCKLLCSSERTCPPSVSQPLSSYLLIRLLFLLRFCGRKKFKILHTMSWPSHCVLSYTFLHVKLAIGIAPHRTHGCDTPQRWALKQCRRATCHLSASTCGCFHTWSCRSTVPFQNWNLPVWFSNENKLEMLSLLVHVATNQTGVPLPNTTRPSKNANPHTPCAILRSDGEQIILSSSSNIYQVWFLY
jgi:hypothetical protein